MLAALDDAAEEVGKVTCPSYCIGDRWRCTLQKSPSARSQDSVSDDMAPAHIPTQRLDAFSAAIAYVLYAYYYYVYPIIREWHCLHLVS
eukprot:3707755-Amphidinium_carterae.1